MHKKCDQKFEPRRGNPSTPHLNRAIREFVAEDDHPKLLVATHVSPDWHPPDNIKCSFLLNTQTGELFILKVQKRPHGEITSMITAACSLWLRAKNLKRVLSAVTNVEHLFGALRVQPDCMILPCTSWDATEDCEPRLVVEVEYRNRGPKESLEHGYRPLTSHAYVRAFLLIKVYKKPCDWLVCRRCYSVGQGSTPCCRSCSCRCRRRGSRLNPPLRSPPWNTPFRAAPGCLGGSIGGRVALGSASGVPVFHSAFSFGTQDLHHNTVNAFNHGRPPTDPVLPPAMIPALPPHTPAAAWQLHIPAHDILYLVRDDPGTIASLPVPLVAGGNDITVDLLALRDTLGAILPWKKKEESAV